MNYKRKSPVAKRSTKCGTCCGQRRHFGFGTEKERALNKRTNGNKIEE